jgi:hypothetical protein
MSGMGTHGNEDTMSSYSDLLNHCSRKIDVKEAEKYCWGIFDIW